MTTIHNLGFPRVGARHELKFALESCWKGGDVPPSPGGSGCSAPQAPWQVRRALDYVPVGDFSFYDQVLDMSFTLGNLPARVQGFHGDTLDNYFRVARGQSATADGARRRCGGGAGQIQWFDTNDHYIVPEFISATNFKLDASRLLEQLAEAKSLISRRSRS